MKLTYIESSLADEGTTSSSTPARQFKLKSRKKDSITNTQSLTIKEENPEPNSSQTNITLEQYTQLLKRFDDLEASIRQINHSDILQAIEMHTLITRDVHGAIFGDLKHVDSPKQVAAKGLLTLANASANSNQASGKKLSNIEEAVKSTKSETEKLRSEVARLHVACGQATDIVTYSWISEAWENVIDEFWPHGAPTDEAIGNQAGRGSQPGTGTGGCTVMSKDIIQAGRGSQPGTGTGGCTVMSTDMNQAGRGSQPGTGTGGCTVMSTDIIQAGRGSQPGTGTGGCTVMSTDIIQAGRGSQPGTGTGGCTVMSTDIIQAGRGSQPGTGTGGCTVMSTDMDIVQAGRGSQPGTGTGGCTVMSTDMDITQAGRGSQPGTGTGGCSIM